MLISGRNIVVMPVSGLKIEPPGGDSLLILAPLGALSKKPPLQTKLSGGSMSQIPVIIMQRITYCVLEILVRKEKR